MNCPKCNNPIDGKKKFCTKCGENVEEYIKEEKEKAKQEKAKKYYKIKVKIALVLFIIFVILVLVLFGLSFFGKQSHKTEEYAVLNNTVTNENTEELYNPVSIENEIELNDDNKTLDYDNDGLTNEEENEYGTSMINSDTDGDGLTDYEEINQYKSDPTKYSTSDDGISDYIKAQRDLKFDRKYTASEVKPEEVEYSYNIKLIPEDLESQYYGGLEEYESDTTVNSTYKVFDMLDFKGTVEYNTNSAESILLIRDGNEYTEFENYKNENGKLIITIAEDDNYKDFVITTKENYENYKNNQ